MALVRKREWTSPDGQIKTAWQADYSDGSGKRRFKQFSRKKDADEFLTNTLAAVRRGTHVARSRSITVKEAAANWIARGQRENLEYTTIKAYEQHVRLHIVPFLGAFRLSDLTRPDIEHFRDTLMERGRSRAMVLRVIRSLTSIIAEAERLGFVGSNVAKGTKVRQAKRDKPRPQIPSKDEMKRLVDAAGECRPGDKAMMMVLLFAGLRASELRGLPRRCVGLNEGTITVDQRVDAKNLLGPPKSSSGRREIPIPEQVVAELALWKEHRRSSELDLVFPSEAGTPMFHANIAIQFLHPVQLKAGIKRHKRCKGRLMYDEAGEAIFEGKYTLHCFRHAAASLWIDQKTPPKQVQTWMGHHSIQMTFDTYGHLFAALDNNRTALSEAAGRVLGGATQPSVTEPVDAFAA